MVALSLKIRKIGRENPARKIAQRGLGARVAYNERQGNYEWQAGDRFNDLKRSPKAPGRLQAFACSAGLERSAA
jgi:hypothetical protein